MSPSPCGFLVGRRTYEIFAAHWPNAGEEEQALAEPMNRLPKYVASTTLSEPLAWQNATLLPGNVAEAGKRKRVVAQGADVMLGLPDTSALDTRARVERIDDAPPEEVSRGRRRGNEELPRHRWIGCLRVPRR